mmetsp:Transcript_28324/g.58023  ORF Transcript_28324/g.58023 Transcript_28324/m.58023 type:complete len:444 (-) Transcript_28324:237-1568(-)
MIKRTKPRKRNNIHLLRGFFFLLAILLLFLGGLAVHFSGELTISQQNNRKGYEKNIAIKENEAVSRKNDDIVQTSLEMGALSSGSRSNRQNGNISIVDDKGTNHNSYQRYDDKYPKDRVYCMIPFIWNTDFYKVIMSTWGQRCDSIYFLTDAIVGGKLQGDKIIDDPKGGYLHYTAFPPGTFPENVIFINMTRSWNDCHETNKHGVEFKKVCRHIWEKMWRSWVYVDEHHSDRAEWFCKVDYDTFFFPENLKYFVRDYKQWDPYNEHHYFGHYLGHRANRPAMIAGACACWSRKTLKGIAQVYRNMPKGYMGPERGVCEDRSHATEEVSTSLCLNDGLGVTAEAARDGDLREFVMLDPYHNQLTWNRTEQGEWWYWKGKPKNAGQMDECCAVRPIAIHKYKYSSQMEKLEQQFYGPRDNPNIRKLSDRSRRYVTKVRRAMGID